MIQFAHSIITSKDLQESKKFYCDCLGLAISKDMGNCFTLLDDSIMIHDIVSFYSNIWQSVIPSATQTVPPLA